MTYVYPTLATRLIDQLVATQTAAIDQAVALIGDRLIAGGVLHVFGTGHARIPAHEMAGRAGGLIPVNLLRLSDLVFHGDTAPGAIADPALERDPVWAEPVLALARPQRGDAFLLFSNSGINGVPVEAARLIKAADYPLVGVVSRSHSLAMPSRHPSGQRLLDLCDVVIDTGAPVGDAGLELPDGTMVGGLSNLAGVVIAQMITEGIARRMIAAGGRPPVYRSMNLADGDVHNAPLEAAYADRIRPIEA